jgi:hypothetical protein
MQNIKEKCIQFFHNEDTRKDITELLSPLVNIIYNELYVYIWVICFYSIFLFILILVNLYLLLKILHFMKDLKIYVDSV